jgi:isochorismate synthase
MSVRQAVQHLTDSGSIEFRTERVESADPWRFLSQHEGEPRVAFWSLAGGVAGAGTAAELRADGPDRFQQIDRQLRAWKPRIRHIRARGVPAEVAPRWVGGFAFQPRGPRADADFPDARFLLPRVQLTVLEGRSYVTRTGPPDAPRPSRIHARRPLHDQERGPLVWRDEPELDEWTASVEAALKAIQAGTVEKVVLARTMTTTLPRRARLHQEVRALFMGAKPSIRIFFVEPRPGHAFLGASPELLLQRENGRIRTAAVAGSGQKGSTAARDLELDRALLSSSKEAWEHELVARFVRGVLATRRQPWTMPVERRLLKLPYIKHIETQFESKSDPDETLVGLAAKLHPTPAVAGAPAADALSLLARLERRSRGWYAGPVGWLGMEGNGELVVGIRCATVRDRQVVLHAGCGIVQGSEALREWRECTAKLNLLKGVFGAWGVRA